MQKVYVVGLGPGGVEQMTARAKNTLEKCDVIAGYHVYIDLIKNDFPGKEFLTTGMRKEVDRCRLAVEEALKGKTVAMISSGDAGVYGMAGIMYQVAADHPELDIEVVPGVLGAPLISDFCLISLSDLLTPWEKIEKRLDCASQADFCICLYNPSSFKRHDYLQKACDIMLAPRLFAESLRHYAEKPAPGCTGRHCAQYRPRRRNLRNYYFAGTAR